MSRTESQEVLDRWLIVSTSFGVMFFTWGTPFSFGVFYDPLLSEFELSRFWISSVYSAMLFSLYALAGLVGIVASRLRIRVIFIIGSVLITGCAIGFQFISSYVGLVVVFAILGTVLGTGFVLITAVIPLWFSTQKSTALGIVFVGNGLGIQIMPLIWEWMIATNGINQAFLIINLITAAMFFVAGLVISRPEALENLNESSLLDVLGWIHRMMGRPKFLVAFLGTGLLFAWYYMLAAQAIPFFIHQGSDRTTAAFLFGLIGGISVPTRIASGLVADRVGPRKTIVIATILVGFGFFLFLLPSWNAIYLSIIIFGLGLGVISPLYIPALLIGFEVPNQTAFVGLFNLAFAIFALFTPITSTFIIALSGGYGGIFTLTGFITIAGAGLFWIGSAGSPSSI